MSDIYQFNVGGTTYNLANLGLLAPVQITLTADRLYNTGDQFIYTGLLYEATETIAQGTSITIGSNAQLADCVTKQISEINSNFTANKCGSGVNLIALGIETDYVASSDGILSIYTGSSSSDSVRVRIADANNQYVGVCRQNGVNYGCSTFIRKGMILTLKSLSNNSGDCSALFMPLI